MFCKVSCIGYLYSFIRGGSRIFGNWFLIKGIAGFKVKTKEKKGKNQKIDTSEWLDVVH